MKKYTAIIHALKSKIGMTDEQYRQMLSDSFGVNSCLELETNDCVRLINHLQSLVPGTVVKTPVRNNCKDRWNDLGGRDPDLASPAQLRYAEGLWATVSRQEQLQDKQGAFVAFVKSRTGVDNPAWLTKFQIRKVIHAIQIMQDNPPLNPRTANDKGERHGNQR